MYRELTGNEVCAEWRKGFIIVILRCCFADSKSHVAEVFDGKLEANGKGPILEHSQNYACCQFRDVIVVDAASVS